MHTRRLSIESLKNDLPLSITKTGGMVRKTIFVVIRVNALMAIKSYTVAVKFSGTGRLGPGEGEGRGLPKEI